MNNIENATKEQLIVEYENCMKDWSKYSCDCFSFYIAKVHDKIISLGGF